MSTAQQLDHEVVGVASEAVPVDFSFTRYNDGQWTAHAGFNYRDLGLLTASHGVFDAQHLRRSASADAAKELQWLPNGSDLDYLYVFGGTITVDLGDGAPQVLGVGDCIRHGAACRCRFSEIAVNSELIVLRSAKPDSDVNSAVLEVAGEQLTTDAEPVRSSSCLVLRATSDAFKLGAGPRTFFEYRDLGVADVTDRRLFLHELRGTGDAAPEGGTDWHVHTMSQWYMVTAGEGNIQIAGHGQHRLFRGDAMSIDVQMPHNEILFSGDYGVIQFCTPADYDTINVEASSFE
jgi:mannose-6-phosphate isomerase-like protein (cupin superfamily)